MDAGAPAGAARRRLILLIALACAVPAGSSRAAAPADPPAAGQTRLASVPPQPPAAAAWPLLSAGAAPVSESFSDRLATLLQREAGRSRLQAIFESTTPLDERMAAERSRGARDALRRGLRSAFDDPLEQALRQSPGLETAFGWLETRVDRGGRATADAGGAADGRTTPAPFDATMRLRLDAHPRFEMETRLGSLRGSIEVPILDHEIRMRLEQPLGTRGQATLRGGRSDARGGWADLALRFSF